METPTRSSELRDPSTTPATTTRPGILLGEGTANTLSGVMRGAAAAPDVIVLDERHPKARRPEGELDPKEDLWLSTADGRFGSPVIPVVVGCPPSSETFYIHKAVISKAAWFRTALCGNFNEARSQILTLPEEDPAVFHFVVAYLYEGTYRPINPAADVLLPDSNPVKKSKRTPSPPSGSDSDLPGTGSDSSSRSRRRIERDRYRRDRRVENQRRKHPGRHRPECRCPQCLALDGPACWNCQAPRMPNPPPVFLDARRRRLSGENIRSRPEGRSRSFTDMDEPLGQASRPNNRNDRIETGEDMRTWLMVYQLSLRAYVCADRYLLDGMKDVVARYTIDMLESAGFDAAVFPVLECCKLLHDGLCEKDPLLCMIFARIGFMLHYMRQRSPRETADFLRSNAEVCYLITCETFARREEELGPRPALPPLERGWRPPPGSGGSFAGHYRRNVPGLI